MVAYSFQARFARPIELGVKVHTLRNPRKAPAGRGRIGGHARPGEELQLYRGMRTRACSLIARKTCTQTIGVLCRFSRGEVFLYELAELIPGEPRRVGDLRHVSDLGVGLDDFARADGFPDFYVMARFWRQVHKARSWSGVLVGWGRPYLLPIPDLPDRPENGSRAAPGVPIAAPPWSAEPWAWGPAGVAERLRRGAWRAEGLRRYRSAVDARLAAITAPDGRTTYVCDAPAAGDGIHADLDEAAAVLLRLDRQAAADSEWRAHECAGAGMPARAGADAAHGPARH